MAEIQRRRGRPKAPFEPYEEELMRRFVAGEALPTVEQEAKHLEEWGKKQGISAGGGALPIKAERIRERIKKRYGGSAGYQSTRQHHRALRDLD